MTIVKQEIPNSPIGKQLANIYRLQLINTEMYELQAKKGELPREAQDLADNIEGLLNRVDKMEKERKEMELKIAKFNSQIKESEALIKRYEKQQADVKNDREYDALATEIELQKLDIQLAKKHILETRVELDNKALIIKSSREKHETQAKELKLKQAELKKVIAKTERAERKLRDREKVVRKTIDERLLASYDRIRNTYKNSLSVATVERDACSGCHNEIPPQIQLELKQNKRVITCEHCGRILVDKDILEK